LGGISLVQDKVLFITGAASGIGYEIAVYFLKHGAKVVFSDLNGDKVQEVTERLRQRGYDCQGIRCDVSYEEYISKFFVKIGIFKLSTVGKIFQLLSF